MLKEKAVEDRLYQNRILVKLPALMEKDVALLQGKFMK